MRDNKFGSFFFKKKDSVIAKQRERGRQWWARSFDRQRGVLFLSCGDRCHAKLLASGPANRVVESKKRARKKLQTNSPAEERRGRKKKTRVKVFLGAKEKKKKRILSWWNGHATLKSLLLHFNPTRTEEPRNFCFLGVFTFFFLFFFFVIFKKFPPRGCKRDSAYEAKICIDDFFRFVTTFAPFIIYERAVCKLKKKK